MLPIVEGISASYEIHMAWASGAELGWDASRIRGGCASFAARATAGGNH
jgi:hypothetical protein